MIEMPPEPVSSLLKAIPVESRIDPDAPSEVVPVDIWTAPLDPFTPALAVWIERSPLDVWSLDPVVRVTLPPVINSEVPALRITSPPTAPVELPTRSTTAPPSPVSDVPVDRVMSPAAS